MVALKSTTWEKSPCVSTQRATASRSMVPSPSSRMFLISWHPQPAHHVYLADNSRDSHSRVPFSQSYGFAVPALSSLRPDSAVSLTVYMPFAAAMASTHA